MPLRWVLCDLNGPLVDLAVLAHPLGGSVADEALVERAFEDAIMQAMVLAVGGRHAAFRELLGAGLRRRLEMAGRDPGGAGDALGLLGSMPAFIDAPAALERLRGAGLRLGVLTQSSAEAAEGVLRFSGLRDRIELVVSTEEVPAFKPAPRCYRLGVERTGARAGEVALVAAHWWDVAGAAAAG